MNTLAYLSAQNAMALQGTPCRIKYETDPDNPVETRCIVRFGQDEAFSNRLARETYRISTLREFELSAGDVVDVLDPDGSVSLSVKITIPGEVLAAMRIHGAVSV